MPRSRCTRQVTPGTILHLEAVAVRALKDRPTPEFRETVDRKHVIHHANAQQNATRGRGASAESDLERAFGAGDSFDLSRADFDGGIAGQLLSADLPKLVRRRTVTG